MIFFKSMVVWLMFILAESINGTIRMLWLEPILGDRTAHLLSFAIGSLLVVAIPTLFIRWLSPSRLPQLLSIGLLWVGLTLAFEMILGRFVLGYSWEWIAVDYDVFHGGLMPFGLVLLGFSPWIATKLQTAVGQSHDAQSRRNL